MSETPKSTGNVSALGSPYALPSIVFGVAALVIAAANLTNNAVLPLIGAAVAVVTGTLGLVRGRDNQAGMLLCGLGIAAGVVAVILAFTV